MPRLQPFTGHVVAAAKAHAVVAPPYDALTPDQRMAMAAADPDSFLNALPPMGPGPSTDLDRTLQMCRRSVDRLVAEGHFRRFDGAVLVVMTLGSGPDRTTAIVGDLPATDFDVARTGSGRVLPHERVHAERVEQLRRYLEVVEVASSPVAVTHRPAVEVSRATAAVLHRPPRLGFRGEDGTDIAVWVVDDPAEQARLVDAVEDAGTLYITDGHHRAAAVLAHAARRQVGPASPAGRVLTAVIPSDRLRVLAFHRRLAGLSGATPDRVLGILRDRGLEPQELDGPRGPDRAGSLAVTMSGGWWSVDVSARRQLGAVEGLDVRLAEREIIGPLIDALAGPDVGSAVEPVAAPAGLRALERPGTVGVALPAPGIDAVIEVADAGLTMPPKTTYVTPKLRSGLLLTRR